MGTPRKLLTGRRFGKLTVTADLPTGVCVGTKYKPRCICRCDCGNIVIRQAYTLRAGLSNSCGCLKHKGIIVKGMSGLYSLAYKHGEAARRTKEYRTWTGMVSRCYSLNHTNYPNYGGRGVTVCDRWRNDYLAFLEDMGRCPADKNSIDRIDPDGNYEPGNCRWADATEQNNNRRKHNKK